MTGFNSKIYGEREKTEKYQIDFYTDNPRLFKTVENICRLCIDSANYEKEVTKNE